MISSPPTYPSGDRPNMVADGATTVPVVEVGSILGAGREAVILHKGERYRLRVTANDKLILTK
ncbi:hemin uptake protein HemP [Phreatobacter cathodiphilus]|nr:hemin uptake protein HemP [Phreatobacter cathodiphilus]